jgi:hypothetical protein
VTERATLLESVPTEQGAKTSAFDVARQRLYVFLPVSSAAVVDIGLQRWLSVLYH